MNDSIRITFDVFVNSQGKGLFKHDSIAVGLLSNDSTIAIDVLLALNRSTSLFKQIKL